MSMVVADTGDMEFDPRVQADRLDHQPVADPEGLADAGTTRGSWTRRSPGGARNNASPSAVTDRLAINFGEELTKIVPGRVSTEVDADLSFDTQAMIAKARAYRRLRGARRSTANTSSSSSPRPGRARKPPTVLQSEGIDCNMTLIFSLAQAIACADAKALPDLAVRRPHSRLARESGRRPVHGGDRSRRDVGARDLRLLQDLWDQDGGHGRLVPQRGEIEALAGCDRLTISPQLLGELAKGEGPLPRKLDPAPPGQAPAR